MYGCMFSDVGSCFRRQTRAFAEKREIRYAAEARAAAFCKR